MIKNKLIDESELNLIPKYETFDYWFYRTSYGGYHVFKVNEVSRNLEKFATVYDTDTFSEIEDRNVAEIVKLNYLKYLERPESDVGKAIPIENMSQDQLVYAYETLLAGCAMIRCESNGTDPDKCIKQIMNCLNWLRGTDFYYAPASTQFHDAVPTGLLKHSLRVVNNIIELIKLPNFGVRADIAGAVLTALVHDWCKIGIYEQYMKNTKLDDGSWVKVPAYRRGEPRFPLGHGDTSAYLASRCFKLTLEEYAAIKWHMGPWYCHQSEYNDLQTSNETYPLVHLLQFADQLSITRY